MKDRVSANPGRVKLTPEDGSPAFYATMERADNPVEEGTPLNKANLLTDATASKFGLSATATPNSVFSKISDELGDADEYTTQVKERAEAVLNTLVITESKSWVAPDNILNNRVRVLLFGGGGGAGGKNTRFDDNYGGGGGGGHMADKWVTVVPGRSYAVTIGAGGNSGADSSSTSASGNGTSGGTTKFGSLVSASGGSGGKGATQDSGGDGGNGGTGGSGGMANGSSSSSTSIKAGNGGNGSYGGGGGGGGIKSNYGIGGNGGNGGTYGGGGGGGSSGTSETGSDVALGGTGGTYGGDGGNGGQPNGIKAQVGEDTRPLAFSDVELLVVLMAMDLLIPIYGGGHGGAFPNASTLRSAGGGGAGYGSNGRSVAGARSNGGGGGGYFGNGTDGGGGGFFSYSNSDGGGGAFRNNFACGGTSGVSAQSNGKPGVCVLIYYTKEVE